MVEVWTEVPLAVVTVGRQSKSWSPSLSCCSGPWNVGVGQPSRLVAQQARGSSLTTDRSQVDRTRSRNGCWWRTGRVQLAMLKWSMALLAQVPLSLPRVWNIQGRSAGVFQFETSFSSRGEYGSQLALKDGAGTLSCVFCWPGQGYRCQSSDLLRYRG
jgi:hypothetical protein